MRSIWTGSVAFGLVNVPVKAYAATQDHDVSLHQVHDADGGRIRYQRRCEVCGKKIDYEHIDKAYDDGERTVVLTDADMASLPAEKSREIEVVQFVPNDQIDPIMLERSYYLEPDSKSPKAYQLLVQTLENTELTAVVKFALRQKTRLGALRVRGQVLVLQGILWADEVREVESPAVPAKTKISVQELKMSSALVDQFRADFNPGDFEDEYQTELRTLIDEKLKQGDALDTAATFGHQAAEAEAGTGDSNVIDLMDALRRSIDKKRTGGTPDGKAASPKKAAGKKIAVKKSTGNKSAADKSAAKEGTGKKAAATKGKSDAGSKADTETKRSSRKTAAKNTGSKTAAASSGLSKGA
ncbi:non-homologous end joining protein Ku [Arthrobacter dokdonensis]|uniref:non-homologous end joining protein Ku n=1 Tax=Arthrobacter dokdonellae TaxID=2211210 RepID=UPI000DE593FD|nr:Ku protein [Arthrobacter dokdonellae]